MAFTRLNCATPPPRAPVSHSCPSQPNAHTHTHTHTAHANGKHGPARPDGCDGRGRGGVGGRVCWAARSHGGGSSGRGGDGVGAAAAAAAAAEGDGHGAPSAGHAGGMGAGAAGTDGEGADGEGTGGDDGGRGWVDADGRCVGGAAAARDDGKTSDAATTGTFGLRYGFVYFLRRNRRRR